MRILAIASEFRWRWLIFFSAILNAWILIFLMQPGIRPWQDSNVLILGIVESLCVSDARDANFLSIFLMWGLMSLAMMAPTAFPAIKTFDDLRHTAATGMFGLYSFVLGYVSAWLSYSIFASFFQVILASNDILDMAGRSISPWLNSTLLLSAGLYQFSSLKNACLSRCRSPLTYFMGNWQEGTGAAFNLGIKLGFVCVGCCWALMALAFIGGTMSLAWMIGAMTIMAIEKMPEIGQYLTRPLGFVLIAGSIATAIHAF